jgi:DivIVA domain-containing protein
MTSKKQINWLEKYSKGLEKLNEIIVEKKFKSSLNSGYNAEEVDKFFDEINQYIDEIKKETASVYEQNTQLHNRIKQLEQENGILNDRLDNVSADNTFLKQEGYGNVKDRNDINHMQGDIRLQKENNEKLQEQIKKLTEAFSKK